MMRFITDWHARRDAQHGIDSVNERLIDRHGTSKAIDGNKNLADRQALSIMQSTDVDEYREQLHRIEDAQAHHESTTSLTLKLAGCFAAEVLGCTLLFRDIGLSGIERTGLGVLFAAFIFWITAQTTRRGAQ